MGKLVEPKVFMVGESAVDFDTIIKVSGMRMQPYEAKATD